MGFLSSNSSPTSYAQSVGIPDFPFLDFDRDTNNKENNNFKELYDMIPGLNTKNNNDVDDLDSKSDNIEEQMKANEPLNLGDRSVKDKGTPSSTTTPTLPYIHSG